MNTIDFAKMHGLGNDFMVLDLVSQDVDITAGQVRRWADRHTGVGFDQLLLIEPPADADADFRYRIYNADGSEAEQCGNGARCVAKLVRYLRLSPKAELIFETITGNITTRLTPDDLVEVSMGVPSVEAAEVPFDPSQGSSCDDGLTYALTLDDDAQHRVVPVSVGNPHGVSFVEEIACAEVPEIGSKLTAHSFFPQRANIGFCQIVDEGFARLRVYERGVGETRACGTGACAAAIAGRITGRLGDKIKISLPGGKVRIQWQGPGSEVRMTGPATLVYLGQITA